MDWLRSEDLKEEKNVTAPVVIIAVHALCRCQDVASVPLSMLRMNPEYLDRLTANILLKDGPDEEEEDEEEHDGGEKENADERLFGVTVICG